MQRSLHHNAHFVHRLCTTVHIGKHWYSFVARKISSGQRCYLFIVGLYCYSYTSPVNRSGPPQASQVQILHTSWIQYKTCTLHKRKTYKYNPKGSPFSIALVKVKRCWYHFSLAFQYQIKKYIKKEWTNHELKYSSPNRSLKKQNKSHTKEPTFQKIEV